MISFATYSASEGCDSKREGVDAVQPGDDCDWLRHSLEIDRLWRPALTATELYERRVSCGHLAFAALARLPWEAALLFFPDLSQKPWINRTAMERALRTIGYHYVRNPALWPSAGLCLLHFTGPWTRRGYPAAILQNTHWIAVQEEYVFDVNWNGWLPRQNWEEVVLEELLTRRLMADGWIVMTSYEVENALDFSVSAALHIATVTRPEEIENADSPDQE
jgi:hypothetical protein